MAYECGIVCSDNFERVFVTNKIYVCSDDMYSCYEMIELPKFLANCYRLVGIKVLNEPPTGKMRKSLMGDCRIWKISYAEYMFIATIAKNFDAEKMELLEQAGLKIVNVPEERFRCYRKGFCIQQS